MRLNTFVMIGAACFAASGILNIFADFMPDTATRLMNFFGVCLGVFGLQALYIFAHQKSGRMGLAGFLLSTIGFLGIAGFLFTDAFVFPSLDQEVTEALTAGAAGLAIFAAVILYVFGPALRHCTLSQRYTAKAAACSMGSGGTAHTRRHRPPTYRHDNRRNRGKHRRHLDRNRHSARGAVRKMELFCAGIT